MPSDALLRKMQMLGGKVTSQRVVILGENPSDEREIHKYDETETANQPEDTG